MTTVQVRQEVDRLFKQRAEALAGRGPPSIPAEGLKIGQVNLGTRQSGTATPVRMEGLNNPWSPNDDRLRIEAVLGGNLPKGTRAVDVYDWRDGGVGISIKTFDTRGATYSVSPGQIASTGRGYIDELVAYKQGKDLWNPLIPPEAVSIWVFRVGYPAGTTDPQALKALDELVAYGTSKGIVVQLVPIEG
jgi:hypothetical protein